MTTRISTDPLAAVELLRAGEIVALPTETVYGLAADALNPLAVAKVFEAKERPRFDPLIVHLPGREMLNEIAVIESDLARSLIENFWPGPLTLLFPKRDIVPDLVTAGLETVAVRESAHPIFRRVITQFGKPIAAPSANRFGRISPTSATAVFAELNERIPLILDGGATEHGIESTIVRVVGRDIEILRRGPVSAEMLAQFGKVHLPAPNAAIIAPGQVQSHYAPRTKLIVVEKLSDFSPPIGIRIGALLLSPACPSSRAQHSEVEGSRHEIFKVAPRDPSHLREATTWQAAPLGMTGVAVRYLSESGNLRDAAANLFQMLRELDHENLDLIVAELVSEEGIGAAINDRLRRAAAS